MRVRGFSFSIIATFILLLPLSIYAATPHTFVAKVERVSDGDTKTMEAT